MLQMRGDLKPADGLRGPPGGQGGGEAQHYHQPAGGGRRRLPVAHNSC